MVVSIGSVLSQVPRYPPECYAEVLYFQQNAGNVGGSTLDFEAKNKCTTRSPLKQIKPDADEVSHCKNLLMILLQK